VSEDNKETDGDDTFTGCVLVAGLYGFATTRKSFILVGQAGLAGITLAALLFAGT
jgi:uncharacterized membrane protein